MSTEGTATGSLDQIREGAGKVILSIHCTLENAKRELGDGRFGEACQSLNLALASARELERAQQTLGAMASARILRASELVVGMRLPSIGLITQVDDHCCPNHVQVHVEGFGSPVQLGVDWMVMAEEPETSGA